MASMLKLNFHCHKKLGGGEVLGTRSLHTCELDLYCPFCCKKSFYGKYSFMHLILEFVVILVNTFHWKIYGQA